MQIKLERSDLLSALDRVRNVVENRGTIPILSNALLEVADGELTITATDLDMEATSKAATSDFDQQDGQITAPMSTLYEVVRKMPDGASILLTYDRGEDARLLIRSGRSKINLPVLPGGDFPVFGKDGLGKKVLVKTADLAWLIDNTAFAMSSEETRYYLQGVYLHSTTNAAGDSVLRSATTDGHRLAYAEKPLPGGWDAPPVIIPRKTVRELRRLLDTAETVEVQVSQTKVSFTTPQGARLVSKVIDGAFPDYQRVIPRDPPNSIKFDPAVMASAVDRVGTISGEKARSTKFEFDGGVAKLTVRNQEAGQAVEEVEVDFDGSAEVGLNARYVLDVLSRIKTGLAVFSMTDGSTPVVVLDDDDPSMLFVIMPLRT